MRCVSRSLRHIWLWENLQTYFLSDHISQMAWQQVGLATFWLWIRTLPFYSLVLEICVEIYLAALYMLWKTTKYLTSFHNVIFQSWKVLQSVGYRKRRNMIRNNFSVKKVYTWVERLFLIAENIWKLEKKKASNNHVIWNLSLKGYETWH